MYLPRKNVFQEYANKPSAMKYPSGDFSSSLGLGAGLGGRPPVLIEGAGSQPLAASRFSLARQILFWYNDDFWLHSICFPIWYFRSNPTKHGLITVIRRTHCSTQTIGDLIVISTATSPACALFTDSYQWLCTYLNVKLASPDINKEKAFYNSTVGLVQILTQIIRHLFLKNFNTFLLRKFRNFGSQTDRIQDLLPEDRIFLEHNLPKCILFDSLSSDDDLKTLSSKRDLGRRQVKTVQNYRAQ